MNKILDHDGAFSITQIFDILGLGNTRVVSCIPCTPCIQGYTVFHVNCIFRKLQYFECPQF